MIIIRFIFKKNKQNMLGKRNARTSSTAIKPKKQWQQEITSDDTTNLLESDLPLLNQDDDDDSEFRKRRKLEEDR